MRTLVLFALVAAAAGTRIVKKTTDGSGAFSYGFVNTTPLEPSALKDPVVKSLVAVLTAKKAALGLKAVANALDGSSTPTDAPKGVEILPVAITAQHHAQDGLGGYRFGYTSAQSARAEMRSPDGVVRGWYSFQDADGVPQKADYVADSNGYRVAFMLPPKGLKPRV